MERIFLDYKFSLFGDFSNAQNDLTGFLASLQEPFTRRLESRMAGAMIVPVYIFESPNHIIFLSNDRIDFVIKNNYSSSLAAFMSFVNATKNYYSSFTRLAFNTTFFFENSDTKVLIDRFVVNPKELSFDGSKEFLVRNNYASKKGSLDFNNIITIGTDEIINKETFVKMRVILFSIDINNVPVDLSSNIIAINELTTYFEYMTDNFNRLSGFVLSFLTEGGNNGIN